MNYFNGLDWSLIAFYLLGIIAFGVWCGRGQKSTRDYFLGNRDISWVAVSLSIVATETSALTFIGVPALAFGSDLTFIQVVFGYVIARIVLAVVMVPLYFRGEVYSPYELIGDRFGPGARRATAAVFLIAGTLAAGVRVYVTCIPLDLMIGPIMSRVFGDAILGVILLFVCVSLVYTFIGGIRAVVWTDAIQFGLLIFGGLFTLIYVPGLIDGGIPAAYDRAVAADKLHWFNPGFSWSAPYNIWMGVLGAAVFVMSSHGADQLIVQRLLTCRTVDGARKALILSAAIILPLFLIFLLVGTVLWVFYEQNAMPIAIPQTSEGFGKNDYVFPIFILSSLPNGIKGILIVGILSAAMSSISSSLSALASVSVMDILKPLTRGARSESYYFFMSRVSTVMWAIILVLVAFATREAVSVLRLAFTLTGLTNGAMLGALLLLLFWKKKEGGSISIVLGMVVSIAAMIVISRLEWTGPSGEPAKLAWPWFTLVGATIFLGVAWVSRRLVRPSKADTAEVPD